MDTKLMRKEKAISWIAMGLYLLLTTGVISYLAFIYHFSFNYEIEINNQYYLVWVWPVAGVLIMLHIIAHGSRLSLKQGLLLLCMVPVACLMLFSKYYHWGNEHFTVVVSVMLVAGALLMTPAIKLIHIILVLVCLLFFYQLYLGYMQYLHTVAYTDDVSLEIKGSFQNSGVMAMYLVTQLPFLFFVIVEAPGKCIRGHLKSNRPRLIVFTLMLAATLFLIYKTQSRTAYVACAVVFASWLLLKNGNILKKSVRAISLRVLLIISMMLLAMVLGGGYYLFSMKKASALGRMMKLQITGQHLGDHFFTGAGLGRFSWYYPQWQAHYFAMNPHPPRSFFLSAGESYIIFNEPLQLLKEIGLIGFVFFIIAVIFFFSLRTHRDKKFLAALKLTVVAILACSFTSYPLHVNYLLWLFFFCFFAAVAIGWSPAFSLVRSGLGMPFNRLMQGCLTSIALLLLIIAAVHGTSTFNAFRRWKQLQNAFKPAHETLGVYPQLKKRLDGDGKFLTVYGAVLTEAGNHREAVTTLEEARTYFISRQTVDLLAKTYAADGQITKALVVQEWLCHFLPNKFVLKRDLLQLYQAAGDSVHAKRVAHAILAMPVKIPSAEVVQIKALAKQTLITPLQK
ncbi:O-antigen ligase family protein [Niabella sp. CJ426]|uniref:O-antigen ligase family protein n=1 Tax=Niabella sp. CJ426 TaxID=3393740 RepID=UPI003D094BB3